MENTNSGYKIRELSNKIIRRDYSKINYEFEDFDLLEAQKNAFKTFLDTELEQVIKSVFPINSPQNKYTLKFEKIVIGNAKRTEEQARHEGKTYEAPLYVELELHNTETGEVKRAQQSKNSEFSGVFFGNIPLMTSKGTFIINGIEKIVIAQIVRSPGAYILQSANIKLNNQKKKNVEANVCEILPAKGTLTLFHLSKDKSFLQVMARDIPGETAPVFPVTSLLKACGLSHNKILEIFDNNPIIVESLRQENYNRYDILNDEVISGLLSDMAAHHEDDSQDKYLEFKETFLSRVPTYDKLLKSSIFTYYELNDLYSKIETMLDVEGEGTPQYEALVNKMNETISSRDQILDIIITEKAASDLVSKFSISVKRYDGTSANINWNKLIQQQFFSTRYYNLTSAGRYKINRKLRISERLYQKILAQDLYTIDGELIAKKDTLITKEILDTIKSFSKQGKVDNVDSFNFGYFGEKIETQCVEKIKVYRDNENLNDDNIITIIGVDAGITSQSLTLSDLISVASYVIHFEDEIGDYDDIDHLGNKRLKLINGLLYSRINVAMIRIEKFIKEKLGVADGANKQKVEDEYDENGELIPQEDLKTKSVTVKSIINTKAFQIIIKDFFNTFQLTQFLDQQNPLAELTNKRRVSAMGPGGISREDPNLNVRDVHYFHYGRICPIETPEGMNIGLIMSLASYTKIDEHGFLTTPYRVVKDGVVTDEIQWLTALQDDEYIISESNVDLDENNKILNETVIARYRGSSDLFEPSNVDYIDVFPKQVVSIATSSIPFLENDDANRALMGANMQRQATPLIKSVAPSIGTGMEFKIAHDSGVATLAKNAGVVTKVDGNSIEITNDDGEIDQYNLMKYQRSNQYTCNNETPIIELGQTVKKNETLTDGPAMQNGELALGRNVLVAFTTWSGYNYEDAIILSDRLVKDDVYTSIQIEEHTVTCLVTRNGDEEITRDVPNVSDSAKKYLDEDGIIMVGAEVKEGDVLVGKITPKGQTDVSPEQKLLQAIFGEKAKSTKDSSLKVAHGGEGIVGAIKRFRNTDEQNGDLGDDVIEVIKVYIYQKRKIQIGDKMAGRHGNKGIVSKIVPAEDMPHLEDGTLIDVLLNPLGVPSRMNIGQILEIHLGLAARGLGKKELLKSILENKGPKYLEQLFGLNKNTAENLYSVTKNVVENKKVSTLEEANEKVTSLDFTMILKQVGLTFEDISCKISTPVFDGCTNENLRNTMIEAGIDPIKTEGKFKLIDGRSGEAFDGPISVGVMYMLKLDHMVDDKIHSRAIGPYSKITQQPLGGKSQNGGQRFGEMEVWALEAYGAAHNLRELLTIKSDDILGRNQTYSAIIKGKEVPQPGIPESFRLLTKQLQGLGLYVNIHEEDGVVSDINDYSARLAEENDAYNDLSIKLPQTSVFTTQDIELDSGLTEEGN